MTSNQQSGGVPSVSPEELAARMRRDEPVLLLDVREPDEREFAAIPVEGRSADVHVPMGTLVERLEGLMYARAGWGGPLVVYCHHGVRSLRVAAWLIELGMSGVMNLEGGIDAYSRLVDSQVRRYA